MFKFGKLSETAYNSIVESTSFINIWEGAVRSGKTIASLIRWIENCKNGADGKFLMVGKTERTLQRNILSVLDDMLGRDISYNKEKAKIFKREIDLVGANDERAESKIRGGTYAGSYVDELTLIPESFWNMLISRHSVRDSKIFATTNPDSPFHYIKTDFIDRQAELDLKVFSFKLEDNTNLTQDYINNLKSIYSGLFYQRFILGLWVLADGVIYDMFDEKKHVIDLLPSKFEALHIAIDYGTANPTVFNLFGKVENTHYLIKEYYYNGKEKKQKTNSEYVSDLIDFIGKDKVNGIFVDPSALSFKTECKNNNRLYLPVKDANNAVVEGIRHTGNILQENKLMIHKSCKNTIKEFGTYIWDAKAQKKGEDKPLKVNDHSMDAIRYYLYSLKADRFRAN